MLKYGLSIKYKAINHAIKCPNGQICEILKFDVFIGCLIKFSDTPILFKKFIDKFEREKISNEYLVLKKLNIYIIYAPSIIENSK